MTTPDITPAWILAVAQAVLAVAVAFGLDMSAEQRDAILDLAKVLAVMLPASDAAVRVARSRVAVAAQGKAGE